MFALTDSGGIKGWVAVVSFVAIGLPFLGVPQLLVRYMSARDDNELKKARIVSGNHFPDNCQSTVSTGGRRRADGDRPVSHHVDSRLTVVVGFFRSCARYDADDSG
jgi:hypothetical protein